MEPLPKEIYFGEDRAERRRRARELAGIREAPDRQALEAFTKREPSFPPTLLGCPICGRFLNRCTCLDSDGNPIAITLS